MGRTFRGRHLHQYGVRGLGETEFNVVKNDSYWWDKKNQELFIEGYDLPPNPEENNKPIWGLLELADKHPEQVKRLYWQCEWEGLGHYSGKHKPLSEQACKLITMTCFGRGICKKGGHLYQEVFEKVHPIKSIHTRGLKEE